MMRCQSSLILPVGHLSIGLLNLHWQIPTRLQQKLAPSTLVVEEGETPSVPETPRLEPEDGAVPPADGAVGVATRIEGKEIMTQTPPLLSRLIQGYLDQTGIEECPYHQMDHGVRDPHCDHCKRALGPLYHHKIVGNRHLPVFTFDFSGPHPRKVNMAQYLLVAVWSLGHMRLLWAFGVESRHHICCVAMPPVLFRRPTCFDRWLSSSNSEITF